MCSLPDYLSFAHQLSPYSFGISQPFQTSLKSKDTSILPICLKFPSEGKGEMKCFAILGITYYFSSKSHSAATCQGFL